MWTEITKHTGNHEMEQHSGSAPLPILGSPSTPLWDKTNKLTKAKQKNPPPNQTLSRKIPE